MPAAGTPVQSVTNQYIAQPARSSITTSTMLWVRTGLAPSSVAGMARIPIVSIGPVWASAFSMGWQCPELVGRRHGAG